MGDFNAHTASEPDYILDDDRHNNLFNLPNDYKPDKECRHKNTDTSKVCTNGKHLLEFCVGNQFKILNKRKIGDLFGKPTFWPPV